MLVGEFLCPSGFVGHRTFIWYSTPFGTQNDKSIPVKIDASIFCKTVNVCDYVMLYYVCLRFMANYLLR